MVTGGRGRSRQAENLLFSKRHLLLAGCCLGPLKITYTCSDVGVECRDEESQDNQTVASESEAVLASCPGGSLTEDTAEAGREEGSYESSRYL